MPILEALLFATTVELHVVLGRQILRDRRLRCENVKRCMEHFLERFCFPFFDIHSIINGITTFHFIGGVTWMSGVALLALIPRSSTRLSPRVTIAVIRNPKFGSPKVLSSGVQTQIETAAAGELRR